VPVRPKYPSITLRSSWRCDIPTREWFVPDRDSPRRDTPEGILLFSGADTADRFDAADEPFPVHWH
jgi:hypothetical protein